MLHIADSFMDFTDHHARLVRSEPRAWHFKPPPMQAPHHQVVEAVIAHTVSYQRERLVEPLVAGYKPTLPLSGISSIHTRPGPGQSRFCSQSWTLSRRITADSGKPRPMSG